MAKKKASSEDNIFNFIASELDGDVMADTVPVTYFLDTGNLAFNWVLSGKFLGGGIPGGKITEFFGPEASGKCIAEDMEVMLSDGEIKTIKEIVESKDSRPIISLNEETQRFEPMDVDQFWSNGEKECFELTTKTGKKVTTTEKHLYLTQNGWKYLGDIGEGEFVAVPKRIAFFGNIPMNQNELKFISYMLAEGCCVQALNKGKKWGYSSNFTNTDEVLIKGFEDCCANLGVSFYREGITNFLSGSAKSILRKYGIIGKSAKTKFVPKEIFSCPKEQISEFLRIFFSCDGYINDETNGIELTLANEKLTRQISHLLVRFGIVHSFRYHLAQCDGKEFDSWRISIDAQEYKDLFIKEINFLSIKHKEFSSIKIGISFLDKFPPMIASSFYNELQESYATTIVPNAIGIGRGKYVRPNHAFRNIFGTKRLGSVREQIAKNLPLMRMSFVAEAQDNPVYRKYMDSDILWDEVISIKSVGKKITYDLGVLKNHNFVANDCIVHNSYWGANVIRGTQAMGGIPVYLDCENALNNDFVVKTSHIDLNRTVRFDPSKGADCLEGVFNKIYTVIKKVRDKGDKRPIVFVYDSIASSPCARELRETQIDIGKCTKEEWKSIVGAKEQPGERAKICSRELRKLGALLEKTNATVLILNQTRMKIGVMYGNPETTAGGGESLKFYASCRVRTSIQKKIENKKLNTSIGINLKVTNKKNRCCAPFREAEGVHLYWNDGVDPLSGLLTCLIQDERIEKAGNGTYLVKEPWAGGQEIKFRASKAKNEIEPDVLYKCPTLIGAATEQEVRDYLTIFGAALKQGANEDNEEVNVSNDESNDEDYDS